jgi:hypothetical protein
VINITGRGEYLFRIITAVIFSFILPNTVMAQTQLLPEYKILEDKSLALEIGEMLFTQPSEGCWTCHVANSTTEPEAGLTKNVGSVLGDPTTWTSHKITPNYLPTDGSVLNQRQIALSLIRLGASDWNDTIVPLIRQSTTGDVLFFDDRMIGIHSKYLKKNSKTIIRMLAQKKVKFKSSDLLDYMATSVFLYIEETFQQKK